MIVYVLVLTRFWAEDTGTYWYHSHIDAQRTMGAYGPLIVLDTSHDETNKKRVRTVSL